MSTFRKKIHTRLIIWAVQRLETNSNYKSYHSFLMCSEQAELLPMLSVAACP